MRVAWGVVTFFKRRICRGICRLRRQAAQASCAGKLRTEAVQGGCAGRLRRQAAQASCASKPCKQAAQTNCGNKLRKQTARARCARKVRPLCLRTTVAERLHIVGAFLLQFECALPSHCGCALPVHYFSVAVAHCTRIVAAHCRNLQGNLQVGLQVGRRSFFAGPFVDIIRVSGTLAGKVMEDGGRGSQRGSCSQAHVFTLSVSVGIDWRSL